MNLKKLFRFAEAASPEVLTEANGDKSPGSKYKIRVIQAGKSKNNVFYPDHVLRSATSLLEGCRVFVKPDAEHLKGGGKSFNQLLGVLSNPTFVEGSAPNTGEIFAEFQILQSAGDVASKVYEAFQRGMHQMFGFSIDAEGTVEFSRGIREAVRIDKFNSVDLIIEPGAGGQLIELIESVRPSDSSHASSFISIKEAKTGSNPDMTALQEELRALREATKEMAKSANAAKAKQMIEGSKLPEPTKQKLVKQFAEKESFTEADVQDAIKSESEHIGKLTESGMVSMPSVFLGETQSDKIQKMWDDFFDPKKPAMSVRECYLQTTGDKDFTGRASRQRITEALDSASFNDVLGNSMNRRLLDEYRIQNNLDVWRFLTGATVRLNDFRSREATRFGGYGDIPIVNEGAAYTALTSPTDEKAEYLPKKRGGTETLTLEMIRNDDQGAVQRIPIKLGRAAKRTVSKFVMNLLSANPVIYDTVTLFHAATHKNAGTAALSAASLAAARLAIMKQTEQGSNEPLGIPPSYLFVPYELEEAAFDLFRRQNNNDTTFIQSLQMKILPVWCFTDTNNWYASVNPLDIPVIELGFLDGKEEPELFVQDMPNVGSMFNNDTLTYKLRHIYGAAVVDYRGVYGAIVP